MDPGGFLSVDVCNLLWSDAVQHGNLFRQVQQRQLLQVQSVVDCGEDKGDTRDCTTELSSVSFIEHLASLVFHDVPDIPKYVITPIKHFRREHSDTFNMIWPNE